MLICPRPRLSKLTILTIRTEVATSNPAYLAHHRQSDHSPIYGPTKTAAATYAQYW